MNAREDDEENCSFVGCDGLGCALGKRDGAGPDYCCRHQASEGHRGKAREGHKVVAFFSEDMKPGSAMRAIKLYKKGSGNREDATMGYNAAKRKVTLWPPNPLKRGVTYKAVVTTRAQDLAGNPLDQRPNRSGNQPKVWYFTIER